VRRDSARTARRRTMVRPSHVASHCRNRGDHRPGHQHVVFEIVKAARGVGTERQDRQQHQPRRGDVDGGPEQRLAGSGRGQGR
jgi:hypothetical protein